MIFHTKAAFSFIKYAGLAGAGSFCVDNYPNFRSEAEALSRELNMRLYRTSVKEDLNVSVVFQHLAENYVNKVGGPYNTMNGCGEKYIIQLTFFELGKLCQDSDISALK